MDAKASDLTPAALIDTDRAFVEKFVLASAASAPATAAEPVALPKIEMLYATLLLLIVTVCACIYLGLAPEKPETLIQLIAAGVAATAAISLLWLLRKLHKALLALQRQVSALEIGKSPTNGDILDLGSSIQALLAQYASARAREELIADSARHLLLCMDKDLRILACNTRSLSLCEYLPEELASMYLVNAIFPDDTTNACSKFAQIPTKAARESFVFRMLTKTKHVIDLSWTVEWSESQQLYFAMAEDITTEKTLERARKESIAMLGHDVRIPLTSILCNLQAISAGTYGPVTEPCLHVIESSRDSAQRLLSMIKELLDFEKAANGRLPLSVTEFKIQDIARQAAAETSGQAATKGITVDVAECDATVKADKDRILRVLINLISNGVKYSDENTQIKVHFSKIRGFIEVKVTDQGAGIASQHTKLVFERYARTPDAESSAIEGAGLGLAICKTIVESHGGLIGVNSTVGSGSTFWFTVPT